MDSSEFAALHRSNKQYRAWFKTWWETDFSISGQGHPPGRYPPYVQSSTFNFGGRDWHGPWLPPHDNRGIENTLFNRRPPIDFNRWISDHQSRARTALKLRGLFATGSISSWEMASLDFDFGHLSGLEFRFDGRNSIINLQNSFVSSAVSVVKTSELTLTLMKSTLDSDIILKEVRALHLTSDGSYLKSGQRMTQAATSLRLTRSQLYFPLKIATETPDGIQLEKCEFHENIDIHSRTSQVVVNIDECHFKKQATISAPSAVHLEIQDSKFDGKTKISTTSGEAPCRLSNCKFQDDIALELTGKTLSIDSILFEKKAKISNGDWADVNITDVAARGEFTIDKMIAKSFSISNSSVYSNLNLHSCIFSHSATLNNVAVGGHIDFCGSQIRGQLSLDECSADSGLHMSVQPRDTSRKAPDDTSLGTLSIRRSRFRNGGEPFSYAMDLVDRSVRGRCTLVQNILEGPLHIEREAFKGDLVAIGNSFRYLVPARPDGVVASAISIARARPLPQSQTELQDAFFERRKRARFLFEERNSAIEMIERGFSNFREAVHKTGNAQFERALHAHELRARRQRTDDVVGVGERILSHLYDYASGYGEEVLRPIGFALALGMLFSIVYFVIGGQFETQNFLVSLEFSFTQLFKPFSVWGPSSAGSQIDGAHSLFGTRGPDNLWVVLMVKILASMQSLMAIALAFVSALALRRRFQIS